MYEAPCLTDEYIFPCEVRYELYLRHRQYIWERYIRIWSWWSEIWYEYRLFATIWYRGRAECRLIECEGECVDLSTLLPWCIRKIGYIYSRDLAISISIDTDMTPHRIPIDRPRYAITGLICRIFISDTLTFRICRRRDHDIRISGKCRCEFLFFWIDILKYDIEGYPLHSDALELLDEICIDRLRESERLDIRFRLKGIEGRIIDLDDRDIRWWSEVICVEPVQWRDILTIDEEMSDRNRKCGTKQSHHSKNSKKRDHRDHQNMFEISRELHTI